MEAAPDSAGAAALIRPFITRFVTGMPPERLNEITTRQALTRWAQSTSTAPARMLQALFASDIGNTPLSTRNFTASPAEAARWLKAPDFVATTPTAEGVSQATGAFVREAEHPLIRNLSSAPTLLTLFAARLTELLTLTATASPISLVHALPTGDHEGISRPTGPAARSSPLCPLPTPPILPAKPVGSRRDSIPACPATSLFTLRRLAMHEVSIAEGIVSAVLNTLGTGRRGKTRGRGL